MAEKKNSRWKNFKEQLRNKYRLVILNNDTFAEKFSLKLCTSIDDRIPQSAEPAKATIALRFPWTGKETISRFCLYEQAVVKKIWIL